MAKKLGVRRSRWWEGGVDLAVAGEGSTGNSVGELRCWRRSGIAIGEGSSGS